MGGGLRGWVVALTNTKHCTFFWTLRMYGMTPYKHLVIPFEFTKDTSR